jgi:signal transduction histidine kinase
MLANGGVGSGLGSLLYVPAVGLALYGSRWESAAVVVPIVVTLFAVSIDSSDPAAATARRVVLLAAVAVMLSVAIHALRERLLESNRHTTRLLLEAEAINMKLEEQATAEERRRIARELHDGLAHELAFIASRARRSARVGAETSDLRELANAADRALDEARRAITVLSTNDPQSLASAVAQAAEDLGARHGIPVSADIREDVDLPGDVLENMLRIVREAITNAALHGQPNRIGVQLVRIQDQLRLVIEDDGCGFDGQGRGPSSGFGLLSMEERAESVGAHLNIDSSPGNGTRVEVTLP